MGQDTSALRVRQFGTWSELSLGHFGTTAELSGPTKLVPKCPGSEVSVIHDLAYSPPNISVSPDCIGTTEILYYYYYYFTATKRNKTKPTTMYHSVQFQHSYDNMSHSNIFCRLVVRLVSTYKMLHQTNV